MDLGTIVMLIIIYLFLCLVSYYVMMISIVIAEASFKNSPFPNAFDLRKMPDFINDPFGAINAVDDRQTRIMLRVLYVGIGPFILPIVLILSALGVVVGLLTTFIMWMFRFVAA
jgi:hypothetical protein